VLRILCKASALPLRYVPSLPLLISSLFSKKSRFYMRENVWYLSFWVCSFFFTQHANIQFHPFFCKWHDFVLVYGWIILHCVFIYTTFSLSIQKLISTWLIP
jgi:hypothetical protein